MCVGGRHGYAEGSHSVSGIDGRIDYIYMDYAFVYVGDYVHLVQCNYLRMLRIIYPSPPLQPPQQHPSH